MRKALLVTALTVPLLAVTATASAAPAARARHAVSVDAQFTALARTLPACGTQTTNCRYGTAATSLQASVQSPTATIYFEMRRGVLTDLEVYPR